MLPEELISWLKEERGQEIIEQVPVSGGCISNGQRLMADNGESYFYKSNEQAPRDMFEAESHGLGWLAAGTGPRIPKVHYVSETFILIEDLRPGKRSPNWEQQLGQELAQLHQRRARQFGLERNNYLGASLQVNDFSDDGYAFFAEQRLALQTRIARNSGLLTRNESAQIDRLGMRLEELVPFQPPALLHGDLWSGNAIWDAQGQPALIDPAVYYGWPEADLAMTMLFGGFGTDFYRAYEESVELAPNWRERLPLYNIYHLLNHLNLFGSSYHQQLMAAVRRFS